MSGTVNCRRSVLPDILEVLMFQAEPGIPNKVDDVEYGSNTEAAPCKARRNALDVPLFGGDTSNEFARFAHY
jgi:hypothetical protein